MVEGLLPMSTSALGGEWASILVTQEEIKTEVDK